MGLVSFTFTQETWGWTDPVSGVGLSGSGRDGRARRSVVVDGSTPDFPSPGPVTSEPLPFLSSWFLIHPTSLVFSLLHRVVPP